MSLSPHGAQAQLLPGTPDSLTRPLTTLELSALGSRSPGTTGCGNKFHRGEQVVKSVPSNGNSNSASQRTFQSSPPVHRRCFSEASRGGRSRDRPHFAGRHIETQGGAGSPSRSEAGLPVKSGFSAQFFPPGPAALGTSSKRRRQSVDSGASRWPSDPFPGRGNAGRTPTSFHFPLCKWGAGGPNPVGLWGRF